MIYYYNLDRNREKFLSRNKLYNKFFKKASKTFVAIYGFISRKIANAEHIFRYSALTDK